MQSHSQSLSDHSAFRPVLIAFVCVVMVLLSGSSPTRLAGTDWLTRHTDNRVERIEAANHTAVPMLRLDARFAEHILDKWGEPADDEETKSYVLLLSDVAAFSSQTGLYESSADRALTSFRLLAFSSRGSPSA